MLHKASIYCILSAAISLPAHAAIAPCAHYFCGISLLFTLKVPFSSPNADMVSTKCPAQFIAGAFKFLLTFHLKHAIGKGNRLPGMTLYKRTTAVGGILQ